ncbi:MarR family transcriptional regulator [Nonomuraea sp. NPDC005692]|uniref:MarR family transcriptional regulator n=1 Tax=Nonomuraea sp. NPDC005692 TaxID=3157168 RepID=UPI0033CC9809
MSTATVYAHRFDAPNGEAAGVLGGAEPGVPGYWASSVEISKAWERAQEQAGIPHTRKVGMRVAMVMSPDRGGVFDVLLRLARLGLGGPVAGGAQQRTFMRVLRAAGVFRCGRRVGIARTWRLLFVGTAIVGAANSTEIRGSCQRDKVAGGEGTPKRLTARPSWLLGQVAAHAGRLSAEAFADAGAHGYHYRLLAALEEYGPASRADLGRRTIMDRSDVAAALNDLAAQDFVERIPDPHDRRSNIVTLTTAGRRQLHRIDRAIDKVQVDLLAPSPSRTATS